MTSLVLRKVRGDLRPVLLVPRVTSEGVLTLERFMSSALLAASRLKL